MGRRGRRSGVRAATDHGDEVGVVRAVELVVVAQCAGVATFRRHLVLGARGVVRRLRPGGRLLVKPGHHHDAVVVARRRHGFLDLVVLAAVEQCLVDLQQLGGLVLGEVLVIGRPDEVAVLPGLVDGLVQQVHRVVLADDQRLSGRVVIEGRGE
jgi:hypothetical protein